MLHCWVVPFLLFDYWQKSSYNQPLVVRLTSCTPHDNRARGEPQRKTSWGLPHLAVTVQILNQCQRVCRSGAARVHLRWLLLFLPSFFSYSLAFLNEKYLFFSATAPSPPPPSSPSLFMPAAYVGELCWLQRKGKRVWQGEHEGKKSLGITNMWFYKLN